MAETPTELLVGIFDTVHQSHMLSETKSSITTPLILSQVCRHWREVILDLPHHWSHIHITNPHNPAITQDMLQRSYPCQLTLVLGDMNAAAFLSAYQPFLQAISNASITDRLHDLRIIGRNVIISRIVSIFQQLPMLQYLIVRQPLMVQQQCYIGPLSLNPARFKTLTLEGIGLHVSHASELSGVTSLTLVRAPEHILNQKTLLDDNHPATPSRPCMTKITQLRLVGTLDMSSQKRISLTFSPSIDNQHLKFLHISDYETDLPVQVARSVMNPFVLEELELENILGSALVRLVGLINEITRPPPVVFARLHMLSLSTIPEFSQPLVTQLLCAFPQLRLLRIQGVDTKDLIGALRDPWLCPLISTIIVDGVEVVRPSPILMIAPPQ